MGCKDDNTCDQPLTKGEFQTFTTGLIWAGLLTVANVFLVRRESKRHERLTYTQENQIRELLQESPSSRAISLMLYDKERFSEEQWNDIFGDAKQDDIIEFYKTRRVR